MTQTQLIAILAENSGFSKKQVETFLKELGDAAQAALKVGEDVPLPGIGKLSSVQRKGREGRNPRTGEMVQIPARRAPVFSAFKALKDFINN